VKMTALDWSCLLGQYWHSARPTVQRQLSSVLKSISTSELGCSCVYKLGIQCTSTACLRTYVVGCIEFYKIQNNFVWKTHHTLPRQEWFLLCSKLCVCMYVCMYVCMCKCKIVFRYVDAN
jgi:hypothetical protein